MAYVVKNQKIEPHRKILCCYLALDNQCENLGCILLYLILLHLLDIKNIFTHG